MTALLAAPLLLRHALTLDATASRRGIELGVKTAAELHLQPLRQAGALEEGLPDARRSGLRSEKVQCGHPRFAHQDHFRGRRGAVYRGRDAPAGRQIRPVHAERVRAQNR